MMPKAQGRGRMLDIRRNVVQEVKWIDELNPEDEHFERRSYERSTLPMEKTCLTGTVMIQDE